MDLPANVAYLYKILGKVLAGRIVKVITSIVRLALCQVNQQPGILFSFAGIFRALPR